MFLTNEQANARLNSEKNLALRFGKSEQLNPRSQEVPARAIDPDAREAIDAREDAKDPESLSGLPQVTHTITEKVIPLNGKNRINLTRDERTEIAIQTRTGASSQTVVAQEHNINLLTVNNIHQGKTKGIDEARVKEVTDSVRDHALDRLMASLGLLTDDKLSGCSAKDLSVIASNMGRVFDKIRDKVETPDNINFIIYSTELKQERAYDVIDI